MTDKKIARHETYWQETVEKRRALLESVKNELIELEAELSEYLVLINEFEFKLRSRVNPLISRLESLESEIKEYLKLLHRIIPADMKEDYAAWSIDEDGAASTGDYRYRQSEVPTPPTRLDPDKNAELKQLYRQLARRFHPDMAVDEADRAYRTGIMMAINAAYAAGDLEKLREILLEPDAASLIEYAKSDEQMAEALLFEIERCHRRIEEIKQELAVLSNHESARLMRKVQRSEVDGHDLLADIVQELREEISRKMVERDILKSEIENQEQEDDGIHGDDFADIVWDLTLEEAYDEDPEIQFTDWIRNRHGRYSSDDDILDDSD